MESTWEPCGCGWVRKRERWDAGLQRKVSDLEPPSDTFFNILEEFPNLRILMGTYGHSCNARRFAKLSKLEYLTLRGAEVTNLESLSSLTNLKRLDWDVIKPPVGIDSLATLPELETLVFTSRLAVGDSLLTTVTRFPHLKMLVLGFSNMPLPPNWPAGRKFDDGMPPITEAGMNALSTAPSLKTLYVGGNVPDDQDTLLQMAERIRQLQVYPALVQGSSAKAGALLTFFPCVVFALAIGLQLRSQFQGPITRLAPNFRSAHAVVTVVFCLLIVVLTAFPFTKIGVNVLTALMLSMTLVATVITIVAILGEKISRKISA